MPDELPDDAGKRGLARPERVRHLTSRQRADILAAVRKASREDSVAPLSEQVMLSVRDGGPDTDRSARRPGTATSSLHLLSYDGTRLAGYAHLHHDVGEKAAAAEVVVDPSSRRTGVGTALVRSLQDDLAAGSASSPELRIWAHGDLEASRAFAARAGYSNVRELWQMRRSLRADTASLPEVSLPERFRVRDFVVGQDEEAWLRVNALAFVDHPEQGAMTRFDLDQRIAQPWFDATGFILIEDIGGPAPVLVASHWTKVVAAEVPGAEPPDSSVGSLDSVGPVDSVDSVGEVYVVGVHPAYQGQGLGRTTTILGLAHLREKGLAEAMLYVDADNVAAVATYSRLDFARSGVDIMYSRTALPPV